VALLDAAILPPILTKWDSGVALENQEHAVTTLGLSGPKRTKPKPRTNSAHCLDPRNEEHIGGRPAHPL
jgi:hypothetical protein